MGCGASSQVAPNAGQPTKAPSNGSNLPTPANAIDLSYLEEKKAELQRQIADMERQLEASKASFQAEQERQRQIRSANNNASGGTANGGDPNDPNLLALQSPKRSNSPPPTTRRVAPPALTPNTPQAQHSTAYSTAPGPTLPSPSTSSSGTKPNTATPSPKSPAMAPSSGAPPNQIARGAPARLSPLRQNSSTAIAVSAPTTTTTTTQPSAAAPNLNRSKSTATTSTATITPSADAARKKEAERAAAAAAAAAARKTLRQSSKQEQMDQMKTIITNSSGARLQRTNTGSSLAQPPPPTGQALSQAKANELKAGLAAGMKRVQGLSAAGTKEGGNFLHRIPITNLRALGPDDLKDIWDHYDADGNGYLDRDELKKLAAECVERTLKMFADQMREANPNITEEQLKKEVDRERYFLLPGKGDGKRDQTQDMIKMLVNKLDINKDGQVSRAELMMQWNSFSAELFRERTAEGALDCVVM